MQESILVIDSYSIGNVVQAILEKLLQIYDAKTLVAQLNGVGEDRRNAAILKRTLVNGSAWHHLGEKGFIHLQTLLPGPPAHCPYCMFRSIGLFAGIGDIHHGFESVDGQCVFISEWNRHTVHTCKANHYCNSATYHSNEDIRDTTLSHKGSMSGEAVAEHIRRHILKHNVLLVGFPCQPFSLAGVLKKNSLGRAHDFTCDAQDTLSSDMIYIIDTRRPAMFVFENVKDLKSYDQSKTFHITMQTLDKLGYNMADAEDNELNDPKIVDSKYFPPQHREHIVLVGFRRDLNLEADFTLRDTSGCFPAQRAALVQLLGPAVEAKYTLTPVLWKYLYQCAKEHRACGNGFGYGMVYLNNPQSVTRTLSARYCKDGMRILIDHGWDVAMDEKDFGNPLSQQHCPHRLTPRECTRLVGFEAPGKTESRIPVSDIQTYRQFGNPVVAPAFAAVAKLLEPRIKQAAALRQQEAQHG